MGIELGEHEIYYQSCTKIKSQVLAEFLVEIPDTLKNIPMVLPLDHSEPKVSQDDWELYIDRAASMEGSRVGLILKNTNEDEITYAM